MHEGDFNHDLSLALRDMKVYCIKTAPSMFQRAGIADFIIQVEKHFTVFCEVKIEDYQLEALQKKEIERVVASGGYGCVLRVRGEFQSKSLSLHFEDSNGIELFTTKVALKRDLGEVFIHGLKQVFINRK